MFHKSINIPTRYICFIIIVGLLVLLSNAAVAITIVKPIEPIQKPVYDDNKGPGIEITVTVKVTDDSSGPWTYSVNWKDNYGDVSKTIPGKSVEFSHTYYHSFNGVATVTVSNNEGMEDTGNINIDTPPFILSTSPRNGDTNVPVDAKKLEITFSEPMDADSVRKNFVFTLADVTDGLKWEISVKLSDYLSQGLISLNFIPDENNPQAIRLAIYGFFPLSYGHHYKITFSGDVKDKAGNKLVLSENQKFECYTKSVESKLVVLNTNGKEASNQNDYQIIPGNNFSVELVIENKAEADVKILSVDLEPETQQLNSIGITLDHGPTEDLNNQVINPTKTKGTKWEFKSKNVSPGKSATFTATIIYRNISSQKISDDTMIASVTFPKVMLTIKDVQLLPSKTIAPEQPYDVKMTVMNTGVVNIRDMKPYVTFTQGKKLINPDKEPVTVAIDTGDSKSLTLSYRTKADDVGEYNLAIENIKATSTLSGENIPVELDKGVKLPTLFIQSLPNLVIQSFQFKGKNTDIWSGVLTFSEGQSLDIRVTVKNEGEPKLTATADDVFVELEELDVQGKGKLITGKQEVPPGEVPKFFDFEYTVKKGVSKLGFKAIAYGKDRNSKQDIPSNLLPSKSSNYLTIQTPPDLEATVVAGADSDLNRKQVIPGEKVRVNVTVTNKGGAAAENINLSIEPSADNTGKVSPAKYEITITSIAGGGKNSFERMFNASSAGEVSFEAKGYGTDANDPGTVVKVPLKQARSNIIKIQEIQLPADLKMDSIKTTPEGKISVGQSVKVEITVANKGQTDAKNVSVVLYVKTESASNLRYFSPYYLQLQDIPGGESRVFERSFYKIEESDIGELIFTTTLGSSTPSITKSIIVQRPAVLEIQSIGFRKLGDIDWLTPSAASEPFRITENQKFEVRMNVINSGEADAVDVETNLNPPESSKGKVSAESTPSLADVIKEAETHEFRWIYKGSQASLFSFNGTVIGNDGNFKKAGGEHYTYDEKESGKIQIQTPTELKIDSIKFSKTGQNNWQDNITISRSQSFDALVTVSNTGESAADNVSAELRGVYSVGETQTEVIYGTKWSFEFNCVAREAIDQFEVIASGLDHNSKGVKTANRKFPLPTIQAPPELKAELKVSPEQVIAGQEVTVKLDVSNAGQAAAVDVKAQLAVEIVGKKAEVPPEKSQSAVGNGNSGTFEWSYKTPEEEAGKNIQFIATVNATDANCAGTAEKCEVSARAEKILLLISQPLELVNAEYDDKNWELTLTFSREIGDIWSKLKPEDIDLLPDGSLGEKTLSLSGEKMTITLKKAPKLAGVSAIGVSGDVPGAGVFAIPDKQPPVILSKHVDEQTSLKPTIYLCVKDNPPVFNSGIDPRTGIKILENGKDLPNIAVEPVGLQDSEKLALKVTLTQALGAGPHTLNVRVSDRKGNKPEQDETLNVFNALPEDSRPSEVISFVTYPNPASLPEDKIYIRYSLSTDADVIINIYDVAGQLIRRFEESGKMDVNKIPWEGRTETGGYLPAGVYICELIAGEHHKYWRLAIRPRMATGGGK